MNDAELKQAYEDEQIMMDLMNKYIKNLIILYGFLMNPLSIIQTDCAEKDLW